MNSLIKRHFFCQKNLLMLFFTAFTFFSIHAQTYLNVKGRVYDNVGNGIANVSINVKGKSTGVISNQNGQYKIRVMKGASIVFSSVGYATKEIVASEDVLDVELSPVVQDAGDDVIVVGYGSQKKINLTGSVATINNKMMENRPMTNISAGLSGLMPGVYVRQSTGLPGSDAASIRVRGIGTLNNSSPMVLVDGVESSMNDINPEDIANISVLKDAASASIYGSKASNGVILITTKKGRKGMPVVSISGNYGKQSPTRLPEYLNSAEYAQLYNEALSFEKKSLKFTPEDIEKFKNGSDPFGHPNTDWLGLLYAGSGLQSLNTFSVSGGSEYVTYMGSANYQNQQGIIRYTGKSQYGGRLNLNVQPSKWIETGFNMSFTRENQQQPNNAYVGGGVDQIIRQANRIAPWIPYKDKNGYYGVISDGNPIAWIDQGVQINRLRNFFLGIGTLTIKPFDGFSVKGVASIKTFTEDYDEYNKEIQYNPSKYHGPTKISIANRADERTVGEVILNYNKLIGEYNDISLMAGVHGELYKFKETKAGRRVFPSTELTDLNGGSENGMDNSGYTRELAMLSYFGRVNYAYMGKYLLEFNVRRDGSSRFAPAKRWGVFPSISLGWRVSQEAFFSPIKNIISDLKVRASWGKLGNQDALDDYYPAIPTLSLGRNYPFNSEITPGAAIVDARNALITWEEAKTIGGGLDITLLRKLTIGFDYYDRLTTGIIMEVPSPETFALNKYTDNVGRMSNKGIEISLQYNDKFHEVDFSFGGNVAYNKNRLLELAGQSEIIKGRYIRRIGEPLDAFYGYKTDGIFRSIDEVNAAPKNTLYNSGTFTVGDLRYVDVDGNGKINADDRSILGNSTPTINFGFNFSVAYKGVDLMAIFNGTAGGYGYMDFDAVGGINGDAQKPSKLWIDRWTPDNPNATVPRVRTGINGPNMPQTNTLSYWLRSSDYLRLKSLQLGYTIAPKFLQRYGLKNARVYISSQNIFTITKFLKGWDPEVNSGRGSGYPVVMVNAVGVNLSF